jgi:cytochrome P450
MMGTLSGVLDGSLHGFLLTSNLGLAQLVRLAGAGIVGLALLRCSRLRQRLALGGALLIAVSFSFMGHTAASGQRWFPGGLLVVHVLAAAFWFGSLVPLYIACGRESLSNSGPLIERFSSIAVRIVPMIFLAGLETNEWVHKRGRRYLRTRDYFADFEKVYGAAGVLPALDGADHFRLRKFLSPSYSRARLGGQLDQLYSRGRAYMSTLTVGDSYRATSMSRAMVNAQLSPLFIGVDTQDLMDDLMVYKERALSVHIARTLPRFTLNTPGMKRRAAVLDTLMERVLRVHTPAQRADRPRNLVDDYLSLHASDPQFLPESNLLFAFSAALIASVYLGDTFSLLVYAMASQPALYDRIRAEADALFAEGDPEKEDLTPASIDVTHRFLMECLRMYPIVPMSVRNVMNTCTVGNYELPVGERIHIAITATHYMSEVFSEPYKFDIDRFLPSRREHHSMGFAPYGLGTHRCLGTRWMEMHLAVNLLMLAHYFTIEVSPVKYARKLRFNPFPSLKPSKKLKFRISEQRRELPA